MASDDIVNGNGHANGHHAGPLSVLGLPLEVCGCDPMTGFYRDGNCETGDDDLGVHVVCARMTAEFLDYTRKQGNDLSTPRPHFPGLKPGDRWCLCAGRWAEAHRDGVAPPVVLAATHQAALRTIPLEVLKKYSFA